MSKTLLGVLLGVVIVAAIAGTYMLGACDADWCRIFPFQKAQAVDSFEKCAAQGYPIMESYPRQCRAGDKTFVESIPTGISPLLQSSSHTATISDQIIQSGIRGTVTIGPMCPVETPGDPACADRPYQTTLRINAKDGKLLQVIATDPQGKFEVKLPAGEYTVSAAGTQRLPYAGPQDVRVEEGKFAEAEIRFDSGIR